MDLSYELERLGKLKEQGLFVEEIETLESYVKGEITHRQLLRKCSDYALSCIYNELCHMLLSSNGESYLMTAPVALVYGDNDEKCAIGVYRYTSIQKVRDNYEKSEFGLPIVDRVAPIADDSYSRHGVIISKSIDCNRGYYTVSGNFNEDSYVLTYPQWFEIVSSYQGLIDGTHISTPDYTIEETKIRKAVKDFLASEGSVKYESTAKMYPQKKNISVEERLSKKEQKTIQISPLPFTREEFELGDIGTYKELKEKVISKGVKR